MKLTIRRKQIAILILLLSLVCPMTITIGSYYAFIFIIGIGFIATVYTKTIPRNGLRIQHLLLIGVIMVYAVALLYHRNYHAFIHYLIAPVLLVVAVYWITSQDNNWMFAVKVVQYIVVIIAILSIVETFTGLNLWDTISGYEVVRIGANGYRFGMLRARGPFETSINNSMFLVLGQGYLWYSIFNGKENKSSIAGLLITFISIFLAMSRATIAASIALAVVLNLKGGVKKIPMRIVKYTAIIGVTYFVVNFFNIESIKSFLTNIADSLRAVIDSTYVDTDRGVYDMGQRLLLFGWIYSATAGHRLFGLGEYAEFRYSVTSAFTKTSIENYYLWQFFRFGWVGLIPVLIVFIVFLTYVKHIEKRESKKVKNKLIFPAMVFYSCLVYLILNLTCAGQNDMLLLYATMGLMMSYAKRQGEVKK